jgi:hypothetical protein
LAAGGLQLVDGVLLEERHWKETRKRSN